jgi:zinc/manganese transport system substrate-binding protein
MRRRIIALRRRTKSVRRLTLVAAFLMAGSLLFAACSSPPTGQGTKTGSTVIRVVAAENQYGNVAAQIGGKYVDVTSVESNPNTDPHSYEVSPGVAQAISGAQLVIQNGVGYDAFMTKVESASPNSMRQEINVQHLLGLPDSTPNPHLWYSPRTMPKVANALADDLATLQPARAAYFKANAKRFITSLEPWLEAIARFKATHPDTPVATTEPVADYMLQAAGTDNLTPFGLQADIMNGVDPSPQDVTFQSDLFTEHKVKVFVYNQQVTDALTQSFITAAEKARIPVIGVYETMPVPGYSYQSWMLAEVDALQRAVADRDSTVKL